MPLAPKPAKVAPSFFGHEGLERPAWFIGRPRSVVGIVEHFFDSLAQKFDVYISPWDGRELVLPNLFGGEGGVWGSIIGAAIIGVLGNGLNLLDVSPFWQRIAQGIVIVVVVIFDQWRRRSMTRV